MAASAAVVAAASAAVVAAASVALPSMGGFRGGGGGFRGAPSMGGFRGAPSMGGFRGAPSMARLPRRPSMGGFRGACAPNAGGFRGAPNMGGFRGAPNTGRFGLAWAWQGGRARARVWAARPRHGAARPGMGMAGRPGMGLGGRSFGNTQRVFGMNGLAASGGARPGIGSVAGRGFNGGLGYGNRSIGYGNRNLGFGQGAGLTAETSGMNRITNTNFNVNRNVNLAGGSGWNRGNGA